MTMRHNTKGGDCGTCVQNYIWDFRIRPRLLWACTLGLLLSASWIRLSGRKGGSSASRLRMVMGSPGQCSVSTHHNAGQVSYKCNILES